MSQFIPRPMNLRSSAVNEPNSPARIDELKKEDILLNNMKNMCDTFPKKPVEEKKLVEDKESLEKDGTIMGNKDIGLEYSYIPDWLEKISRKYLCVSLVLIEDKTLYMYNIISNHQVCSNIRLCCDTLVELGDDIIAQQIL